MTLKISFTSEVFSRIAALMLTSFVLLTACSGGSPALMVVMADFSAYGVNGTVNGQDVTIDLSELDDCSTTVENMVIGVQANGAFISPDPRIARDYSQPVQFTLIAPDGSKAVYNVRVKGAACPVCTAVPLTSTGYSLVFKGCSLANVAEYYDKTECVRDNVTGLIWQGQTAEGTGLRANDRFYTNFDSTAELQKWYETSLGGGYYGAPTQVMVDDMTNTIGFKNAVNATNLCGSGVWRLPTKDELMSIVKTSENPKIDKNWFLNAPKYTAPYWTSTPYVDPTNNYDSWYAWTVEFSDGFAFGSPRNTRSSGKLIMNGSHRVRLVHSGLFSFSHVEN
jgi:Protein of unknown function (DUF1566)